MPDVPDVPPVLTEAEAARGKLQAFDVQGKLKWVQVSGYGNVFVPGEGTRLGRLTGPFGVSQNYSMQCCLGHGGKCRLVKSSAQLGAAGTTALVKLLLAGLDVRNGSKNLL